MSTTPPSLSSTTRPSLNPIKIFFPFPLPLSLKQWIYIAGMQGLVAGVIDGGANFGVAYAMYHGQEDVRMWVFSKNTIAGDLGVTPLIQTAASMIITSTLVHTDIHSSQIIPLAFVWPHVQNLPDPRLFLSKKGKHNGQGQGEKVIPASSASSSITATNNPPETETPTIESLGWIRYHLLMLLRFIFEGTENNMLIDKTSPKPVRTFFKRLLLTALQGLGLGVVFGLPLWCLAVVILGPIYGTGNMGNRWAPQAIKLVYGFILGIITNPVIACLALGSQAELNLIVHDQPVDVEKHAGAAEEPAAAGGDVADGSAADAALGLVAPQTPLRNRGYSNTSSRRTMSFIANINDIPRSPALGLAGLPTPRADQIPSTPGQNMPTPSFLVPPTPSGPGPTSPLALGASLSPSLIPAAGPVPVAGPSTPRSPMKRPRAMTASSETGSYYSLGGTGGRAQRRRAPSAVSVFRVQDVEEKDGMKPHAQTQSLAGMLQPGRQRGLTESTISPIRQPGSLLWAGEASSTNNKNSGNPTEEAGTTEIPRSETASLPGTPNKRSGGGVLYGAGRLMSDRSQLEAPRESMEVRAEKGEEDVEERRQGP